MFTIEKIKSISPIGRVVAILLIVIFHLFDSIEKVDSNIFHTLIFKMTHIGSQGIHFFFFISAFFLYLKYNTLSKYNLFFLRWLVERLKKLYPTYITSIFLISIIYYLFLEQTFSIKDIIINILPLIRNFSNEYIHSINGNFWFLHTLIEFYLIFPLLIKISNNITNIQFILFTYFIVILYILYYTFYLSIDSASLNPYSSFFINYLYDFSLGIILAKYLKIHKQITFKLSYVIIFIIFFELIGVILSQYNAFGRNINDLFFSISIILIILLLADSINHTMYKFILYPINFFKTKVYDIYLVHHPIIKIITSQEINSGILLVSLGFIIIIPISFINFYISNIIKKVIE
jgi:peptidoglycan/LPS O-acetylase OafA/YrhL